VRYIIGAVLKVRACLGGFCLREQNKRGAVVDGFGYARALAW